MKTSLVFFALLLLSPRHIAALKLPRRFRGNADIPEDDGGPAPTKLEQKKIDRVKKKMFVPGNILSAPRWLRVAKRIVSRKNNNNDALFKGLDFFVRSEAGTPIQRIVDIGKDIDFDNKTREVSGRWCSDISHSLGHSCLLFLPLHCAHSSLGTALR